MKVLNRRYDGGECQMSTFTVGRKDKVLVCCPRFHVNFNCLSFDVILMLSLLSLFTVSCAQCCGESIFPGEWGLYIVLGIMMVCSMPSSSGRFHCTVPCWVTRVPPPYPPTNKFQDDSSPMKLLLVFELQNEDPLST